ncbi:MAG: M23 family metallopeptidase [Spirochaetales bacterium]|nr:M23 family metallopeptidase [Spirochaetales bacterium]
MREMRNYRNYLIFFLAALFLLQNYALFGETHRVVQGDTLYSIARKHDISVKDLMNLNGITNPSSLSLGMELQIPGTLEETVTQYYTVKKGDTYYSISRRHGLSVDELLNMNRLTQNDVLSIGQKLAVANGGTTPTVTSPSPEPTPVKPASTETSEPTSQRKPQINGPITGGPSLVIDRTGQSANQPKWPVTGSLFTVDGDFEGVMIESVPSTYVEAVSGGEVVWSGPYWEFGEIALVEDNGYIYFYGGNSDIFVNVGQKITPGTRIGRLENIDGKGNMYFTIFKEGEVIDLARAN